MTSFPISAVTLPASIFFFQKKPLVIPTYNKGKRSLPRVSCQDTKNNNSKVDHQSSVGMYDRRIVLIGLGGLYGAVGLVTHPFAFAAPISAPDLTKCGKAELPAGAPTTNCCPPPSSSTILDFKLPVPSNTLGQAAEMPRTLQFPLTLDKKITSLVSRPRKSRSKKEKEEEEEVLVIEGIQFERDEFVKFDVYINDEHDSMSNPTNTEFAGSFVNVPHKHKHGKKMNTILRLGITDLLDDLDCDNDDNVRVTLVPKYGSGRVTIAGIKIEFAD